MTHFDSFAGALASAGPAPDRAEAMGLYGWLVGSWAMKAQVHGDDGVIRTGDGEVHAAWVLEGRAIQDVWILPEFFFGTTLRIYDPGLDAWHILWNDPVKQYYTRQIGRAAGADIVQEGRTDAGVPVRWRFVDMAPDSFRWLGERRLTANAEWTLQSEFRLARTR